MRLEIIFNRCVVAFLIFVAICLLCADSDSSVKFFTTKLCGALLVYGGVAFGSVCSKADKL